MHDTSSLQTMQAFTVSTLLGAVALKAMVHRVAMTWHSDLASHVTGTTLHGDAMRAHANEAASEEASMPRTHVAHDAYQLLF